jgi:hypothetical protein
MRGGAKMDARRIDDLERRLDRLETNSTERFEKLEGRVATTEMEQARSLIYIEQIFGKLEDIKTSISNGITKDDLIGLFRDMNANNQTSMSSWQKWTLAILAGTIFIVIGYIFSGKFTP